MIEGLAWERPAWLLAVIPLALLLYRLYRRHQPFSAWRRCVDEPLLQALEVRPAARRRVRLQPFWGYAVLMHLALAALAGPVVETADGQLALGPWLSAGLLPLAALAFRRGWLSPPAAKPHSARS